MRVGLRAASRSSLWIVAYLLLYSQISVAIERDSWVEVMLEY